MSFEQLQTMQPVALGRLCFSSNVNIQVTLDQMQQSRPVRSLPMAESEQCASAIVRGQHSVRLAKRETRVILLQQRQLAPLLQQPGRPICIHLRKQHRLNTSWDPRHTQRSHSSFVQTMGRPLPISTLKTLERAPIPSLSKSCAASR